MTVTELIEKLQTVNNPDTTQIGVFGEQWLSGIRDFGVTNWVTEEDGYVWLELGDIAKGGK
tara:strand:+ start:1185 stop:1367 length:183 start_codon:yes stop_codon:yes gene_type:complete